MSRDLYRHAILVCHANCKMSMKSDNRLELRPAMLHLLYFLRLLNYSQSDSDLCMIAGRCSSFQPVVRSYRSVSLCDSVRHSVEFDC